MLLQISKGLLVNQLVPLHRKILILQYKFKQNNMFNIPLCREMEQSCKDILNNTRYWMAVCFAQMTSSYNNICYLSDSVRAFNYALRRKKNYNVIPWPKKICLSYDGKWLTSEVIIITEIGWNIQLYYFQK